LAGGLPKREFLPLKKQITQERIIMKALFVTDQAAGETGTRPAERPEPPTAINDVSVRTPMSFRFITKSVHAYLIDYPVAIALIAAPFVLKLGQSGPVAMWLSVFVGVAALLLAALTDHPTGLVRIIPYWLHLWVDRAVGVLFVIAPFAFEFAGLDAWYYWVLAAAVLLTTSVFNAPEEPTRA
jgi:hypothetical protein